MKLFVYGCYQADISMLFMTGKTLLSLFYAGPSKMQELDIAIWMMNEMVAACSN